MARTKQTARKSSGGKAPRRQTASADAGSYRAFMTTQQKVDNTGKSKSSYINHENTFRNFSFQVGPQETHADFSVRCSEAICKDPLTKSVDSWLGLSFVSRYDGPGISEIGRPNLNLIICIDVSGSMACSFENQNGKSKIDIAKTCLQSIVSKLRTGDTFGVIQFNASAHAVLERQNFDDIDVSALLEEIDKLEACGGTTISEALKLADSMYKYAPNGKSNRVILLTDMETNNDENKVLSMIKQNAQRNIYTSIVGIDVDLCKKLVEDICLVPGARYLSVASEIEFRKIMEEEFAYDVTPVAFDIRIEVKSQSNGNIKIEKAFGSSELNSVSNTNLIKLSSEFPNPIDEKGGMSGNILLLKLSEPTESLVVDWKYNDAWGSPKHGTQLITMDTVDHYSNSAIRKAIVLSKMVELQQDYVTEKSIEGISYLDAFTIFRDHFLTEMAAVEDDTIQGENKWIMEGIIDKIIELEKKNSTAVTDSSIATTVTKPKPAPKSAPKAKAKAKAAPTPKPKPKPKGKATKRTHEDKPTESKKKPKLAPDDNVHGMATRSKRTT